MIKSRNVIFQCKTRFTNGKSGRNIKTKQSETKLLFVYMFTCFINL